VQYFATVEPQKRGEPHAHIAIRGTIPLAPAEGARPLLREVRQEMGLDPHPMAAYAASGYPEKIAADRVGGRHAGWGA
jgi:L-rhamnose isomerase